MSEIEWEPASRKSSETVGQHIRDGIDLESSELKVESLSTEAKMFSMPDSTTQFAHYPSLKDRVVLITGGATGIGESFVTDSPAKAPG